MVILKVLGLLLLLLAEMAAIIGLPFWLGLFLGRRVVTRFPRWSHFTPALFALLCALRYALYMGPGAPGADPYTHILISIYSLFMVAFLAFGISFGRAHTETQIHAQKQLAAWQKRLSQDASDNGSSIQIACDHEHIGDLYLEQGKMAEAASSYEHAYGILSEEFGDHPQLLPIMGNYVKALRATKRVEEADKIEQQLTAIKSRDGF